MVIIVVAWLLSEYPCAFKEKSSIKLVGDTDTAVPPHGFIRAPDRGLDRSRIVPRRLVECDSSDAGSGDNAFPKATLHFARSGNGYLERHALTANGVCPRWRPILLRRFPRRIAQAGAAIRFRYLRRRELCLGRAAEISGVCPLAAPRTRALQRPERIGALTIAAAALRTCRSSRSCRAHHSDGTPGTGERVKQAIRMAGPMQSGANRSNMAYSLLGSRGVRGGARSRTAPTSALIRRTFPGGGR